jgi:hypothetical protein
MSTVVITHDPDIERALRAALSNLPLDINISTQRRRGRRVRREKRIRTKLRAWYGTKLIKPQR